MKKYIIAGFALLIMIAWSLFLIWHFMEHAESDMIDTQTSIETPENRGEPDLDLYLDIPDEEKDAIQSDCTAISKLYWETYQKAEKVPSQDWNTNVEVTQDTIDTIEDILIEAGYPVINSDRIYPQYLENSDCFMPFWACVKQEKDTEVSFWGISSSGGLYYRKFQFKDGEPCIIFAVANWNDEGNIELSYLYKRKILYWDITDEKNFIYQDEYLNRHWDAAHRLRLHPVDPSRYDLTMKYILPIGYQNVNLFLVDWNSENYGKLCFNDLLEFLYRIKFNDFLYARDYPLYTASYPYSAIPGNLFEDTILSFFDISIDELRERALYDSENDIYPWQSISGANAMYYPTVTPEVTECEVVDEHTIKLVVNVACPDYHTDKLFIHEVIIRVLDDGSYHYIGNQIVYKDDISLPSPQARIPVQRFSTDDATS